METIKRINLFGGAGSGKSTMAARLFYELKIRDYDVYWTQEWIKVMAIRGEFPRGHEQLHAFDQQKHSEEQVLPYVQAIISDSPLLMNAAYSLTYGYKGTPQIIQLACLFEQDYPGLHFWLPRRHVYKAAGRYQTEAEALEIDQRIRSLMIEHLPFDRLYMDELSFDDILAICVLKLSNQSDCA